MSTPIETVETDKRTVRSVDRRGLVTELEIDDGTPEQRAARFKTIPVEFLKGNQVLETVQMTVTEALKCPRPGKRIKGLRMWVDTQSGKLRLKPVFIELVKATEGLADNLPNWARYDEWISLKAARDLHFGYGLWVFEDEEFFYPLVLCRNALTTKNDVLNCANPAYGVGFPAYTADGRPPRSFDRSKPMSALPWLQPGMKS
jgi:hypothetical protein